MLDLDPVSGDHRHVRIGRSLWDETTIRTPWGEETTVEDLNRCQINGRQGFECMDLRVTDDGPVCVATWLGEADSAMLRTYRAAVTTARERLSRKARRNAEIEANAAEIAREAAEESVMWLIRTSDDTGVPSPTEIEDVVDRVVSEQGIDDPLRPDDLDPERSGSRRRGDQSEIPDPQDRLLNDGGER
jgi:hypothetical protein